MQLCVHIFIGVRRLTRIFSPTAMILIHSYTIFMWVSSNRLPCFVRLIKKTIKHQRNRKSLDGYLEAGICTTDPRKQIEGNERSIIWFLLHSYNQLNWLYFSRPNLGRHNALLLHMRELTRYVLLTDKVNLFTKVGNK